MSMEEPSGQPVHDYQEVQDESDVYELIEEGVIGTASEYGFSCAEEMVDYLLGRNGFQGIFEEQIDRLLEVQEEERDEHLEEKLEYAGGIWYNPENGDQWITNDEELDDI